MYGKHFASMYTGSMFGKPAIVFAVWGYVISHMREDRKSGQTFVELNPTLLASVFATSPVDVCSGLDVLEGPDPASRTPEADGRRLILMDHTRHMGPLLYQVVNGAKYHAIRDEEERRAYLRDAKRASRARSTSSTKSTMNGDGQPLSTNSEAEEHTETEPKEISLSKGKTREPKVRR